MEEILANPALRIFGLCVAILGIKTMLTGNMTGLLRVRRNVFITPEDYRFSGATPDGKQDETIERLRGIHRNDIENLVPFIAVGLPWALTAPSATLAGWLFGIFTVARLLHTVAYLAGVQPWRAVLFLVNTLVSLVIAILLIVAAL